MESKYSCDGLSVLCERKGEVSGVEVLVWAGSDSVFAGHPRGASLFYGNMLPPILLIPATPI